MTGSLTSLDRLFMFFECLLSVSCLIFLAKSLSRDCLLAVCGMLAARMEYETHTKKKVPSVLRALVLGFCGFVVLWFLIVRVVLACMLACWRAGVLTCWLAGVLACWLVNAQYG